MSSKADPEDDVAVQIDADTEELTKQNLKQLFDLHGETFLCLADMLRARGKSKQRAADRLRAALVTELVFLRPHLEPTGYWEDHYLGSIEVQDKQEKGSFSGRSSYESRNREIRFSGFKDILAHRNGVTIEVAQDNPQVLGSPTQTREKTYDIPQETLSAAVSALQDWMSEVGLTVDFDEIEDKPEFDYSDLLEE